MKKVIYVGAMLIVGFAHSQVGIGTRAPAGKVDPDSVAVNHPKGILHLQGQHYYNDSITRNLGFVVPRVMIQAKVDTTSVDSLRVSIQDNIIKTPAGGYAVEGTMVFDSIEQCLRVKTADGAEGWDKRLAGCLVSVSIDSLDTVIEAYEGMPIRAKKVSAGYNFSVLIDATDGMLYSAGYNYYGRTGLGTTSGNTTTFKMVLARVVTDISAGYEHGLAIDSTGKVWSWGAGSYYRTGQPTTGNFPFPRIIRTFPSNVKAVRVEAGQYNSLVLGSDGKVYTFGSNANGLNGNGATGGNPVSTPQVISSLQHIKDIALSQYTAAAIDSTGKVWVWGLATNGRLGNGATTGNQPTPVQISFPSSTPIKQVALGDAHGVAISEDGKHLYGWGNTQAWGVVAGATPQTTPVEITANLPQTEKIGMGGVVKGDLFIPATDTIISVAATRFRGGNSYGTIVITNRNAYAAGNSYAARGIGLGNFERTGAAPESKYSPRTINNIGTWAGFYPLYNGAMYEGTEFIQASIGYNHGLILEKASKVKNEDGTYDTNADGTFKLNDGFGYGTGEVGNSQLGAVDVNYATISIFTLLKK